MPGSSWEQQAKRASRIWKWLIIILLVVVVAGIIIYNNRDIIFSRLEFVGEDGKGEIFSLAPDSGVPKHGVEVPEISVPHPAQRPVAKVRQERRGKVSSMRGRNDSSAVPVRAGKAAVPEKKPSRPQETRATTDGHDSVDLGNVPCRVSNRDDIVVVVQVTVYCHQSKKREVVVKRDALSVLTQSVLRSKELEEVKFGTIKEELRKAMNRVFDTPAITGIAFRSVKIEKAVYE